MDVELKKQSWWIYIFEDPWLHVAFKVFGTIESAQSKKRTKEQPVTSIDFIGYYANANIYSKAVFPKLCFAEH